jgi:polyhydroxybutyrate depolymerase
MADPTDTTEASPPGAPLTSKETDRRSRRDRRGGIAELFALGRRGRDVWRRRLLAVTALAITILIVGGVGRVLWPSQFAPSPRTERRELHVGGRTRSFLLHHPERWDAEQPLPLVLVFHGHLGDARTVQYESQLDEVADRAHVLVAYPNGTGRLDGVPLIGGRWGLTWNAGACCTPATTGHVNDVAFATAIVRQLVAEGSVDPHRVYATGFSIGGTFALRLACDRAALVAAVADVEGTMPDTTCAPERRVPVMLVSGTEDDELRADLRENRENGSTRRFATSMRGALRFWAVHDGCTGSIVRTQTSTVRRDSATDCPRNRDVQLLGVHGNEHAWPGGRKPWLFAPSPAMDVPLSQWIVDFFMRHSRG